MTTNLTTRKGNKMVLDGDKLSGDTFPVRDYLKKFCGAHGWHGATKTWTVDIPKLNEMGIRGIFLPGTPMQDIIDFIQANARARV